MIRKNNKGFTLIELLVVMAVIAVLVTAAVFSVGSIMDKTKRTVTLANARTMSGTIQGLMSIYDNETSYAPRSSGSSYDYSETSMNNYLEKLLEGGVETENDYSFINQYNGKSTILNWTSSISGEGEDPAVFLTNTATYAYDNSTPSRMSQLEGTIIVYFATEGSGSSLKTTQIEVYCTDDAGVKSDKVFVMSM